MIAHIRIDVDYGEGEPSVVLSTVLTAVNKLPRTKLIGASITTARTRPGSGRPSKESSE